MRLELSFVGGGCVGVCVLYDAVVMDKRYFCVSYNMGVSYAWCTWCLCGASGEGAHPRRQLRAVLGFYPEL